MIQTLVATGTYIAVIRIITAEPLCTNMSVDICH